MNQQITNHMMQILCLQTIKLNKTMNPILMIHPLIRMRIQTHPTVTKMIPRRMMKLIRMEMESMIPKINARMKMILLMKTTMASQIVLITTDNHFPFDFPEALTLPYASVENST
jgi:hypothetical protein